MQKREDALRLVTKRVKPQGKIEDFQAQHILNVLEDEKMQAELGAQEHLEVMGMRRNWSTTILVCVVVIVCFDFFLILAVGFGWMRFDNGWVVPTFIVDSLLKVLGLATIIVKYLFGQFKPHGK